MTGQTRIATKLTILTTKTTTTDMGVYYYHPDHIGSASTVTDNNGKFTEHCEYFPYGEVWISESASTSVTSLLPFKFTSKELDPETGLYYYGARYMDPRLGRFISTDPPIIRGDYFPTGDREKDSQLPGLGGVFNTVNLNSYHYAANNPIRYTDPDGNILGGDDAIEITAVGAVYVGLAVGALFGSKWCADNKDALARTILHSYDITKDRAKELAGHILNAAEAKPKAVGDHDKLPNQGQVTGGVDDAPPVDAGKQGKHVPGHNNEEAGKSKWKAGENGVRQTQEAWKNGKVDPSNKREGEIRIGKSSDGRTVRVHQEKGGSIHGYPINK